MLQKRQALAGAEGLSSAQAEKRLKSHGENTLKSTKKVKPTKIFLAQFKDVMIIILLISTLLSVFMGEYIEAITIIAIVVINAVIGFFQEFKTEKTLDALKELSAPTSKALRDGKIVSIPSRHLVTGDVILVEAGDKIPADCLLIECSSLQTDESLLTGESLCVEKLPATSADIPNGLNCPQRLYMGTIVTQGHGKALVTHTAMDTQMGKIAGMLDEIEEEPSPLQKRLDGMGKTIGIGCLVICFIVAAIGIIRGQDIFEMIVTGISLAVAAIPEGLPAIVTISLALAVGRMVKRKALIRKLHMVETLGCATVICSDKTGTLTQNKMTVKHISTFDKDFEVSGNGYEKAGHFLYKGQKATVRMEEGLQQLFTIGVLCNNSQISTNDKQSQRNRNENTQSGSWNIYGDPMEAAILVAAAKAACYKEDLENDYTIEKEIPFDSKRKMMSVIAQKNNRYTLFAKGGVDVLLGKCSYVLYNGESRPLDNTAKKKILQRCSAYAENGLRVLGFAKRNLSSLAADSPEQGMTFVGMCALEDPPRPEAFAAVKKCRHAGIKPIMITGDHKETAKAIARQLSIFNEGDMILTGSEIDTMSPQEFSDIIMKVSVFARVSPAHKLQIVKALKAKGHIVAMTGDGVNDAPAIKEADIGVSMGISGTDVTKEASSMILMDDNFATLVAAVEEGRVIYNNIRRFIRYLISCNIGEVGTMFLSMTMGMPLVLFPIHILLINLVTDGLPAIALGLEPPEKDVMNHKPRRANDSVFSDGLLSKILFRGALIALTTLGVFITVIKYWHSLELARTAAFLTLVLTQLIHAFECKSERVSLFKINFFSNKKLILAVLTSLTVVLSAIYITPLQFIFQTKPLDIGILFIIAAYCMVGPILSALLFKVKHRLVKVKK